jgi:hypothetical protein
MKEFAYDEPRTFPGGVFDAGLLRLARLRRGMYVPWAAAEMGLPPERLAAIEDGDPPAPPERERIDDWLAASKASHGDTYYRWLVAYVAAYKAGEPMPDDLVEPWPLRPGADGEGP